MADTTIILQRRMPRAPGWPVLGDMTLPDGTRYSTLEDPWILVPRTPMTTGMNQVGYGEYTATWPYTTLKLAGVTAIPARTYRLLITYSTRFRLPMPRLLDVPEFTGILIHPLNVSEETQGCIGIGKGDDGKRTLLDSRNAFGEFVPMLESMILAGVCRLEVRNPK